MSEPIRLEHRLDPHALVKDYLYKWAMDLKSPMYPSSDGPRCRFCNCLGWYEWDGSAHPHHADGCISDVVRAWQLKAKADATPSSPGSGV